MPDKPRFIAFSGGVESTTMCLLYGKGAKALWCDTGAEHEEMYKRIDKVEAQLKEYHRGDFELIRIKPAVNTRQQPINNLVHLSLYWKYAPSLTARWCTKFLKIKPIDNFLKEQGDCELMIGLNADETPGSERAGNWMECDNVTYTYPLHEEGRTRDDCEEILYANDLHPNLPPYMQRGGCWMCPFKKIGEYKALYVFNRPEFEKARRYEKRIQDRRKKFYAISMSLKTLDQIATEIEQEIQLWGIEAVKQMYQKVTQSQACGAFCHR